jgi:CIC family chloride channel protein
VEGVGYSTIQEVLTGVPFPFYLLTLLFAAKLLATSLTLGSGASGGVFSPALFLGATSGAAWGIALNHFFPSLAISPAAFAVAGMGGVVGGATGAAMAAIVMIFEMTLDYTVIVPMTLTVAISYAVRRSLMTDSIYTRKLTLRKEPVPETMRADVQLSGGAARIMQPVRPQEVARLVADEGCVAVTGNASLWEVIARMRDKDAAVALVTEGGFDPPDVKGMITRKDILDALADDLELF